MTEGCILGKQEGINEMKKDSPMEFVANTGNYIKSYIDAEKSTEKVKRELEAKKSNAN